MNCQTHKRVHAPCCPVCLLQERDEARAQVKKVRAVLEKWRWRVGGDKRAFLDLWTEIQAVVEKYGEELESEL